MSRTVRPPPVREPGSKVARPRDAATLIIYRRTGGADIEVLMGERHAAHRFMPSRYVFPGGRIDPQDSRIRTSTPLGEAATAQLERKLSPARARAMAIAAVRETFEETGLIIGAPDPAPHRKPPAGWEAFFETGFAPALGDLEYVARALTPPIRPVRFNARFFIVESRHVTGEVRGSGELLDLNWFPLREAAELELAGITKRILRHIDHRFENGWSEATPDRPVTYFKWVDGGHILIDE